MDIQQIPDAQARELLVTGIGVIVRKDSLQKLMEEVPTLRAQLAEAQARAEKAEVERADALRCSGENAKAWQACVEESAIKRTHLIKEIGMGEQRISSLEAERDALAAHVERLMTALECIPVDLIHAIENGEAPVNIFLSAETCRLLKSDLSATPQASLARVRAEALRTVAREECKTVFDSDLPHVTQNELLDIAERLESEAANG